MSDTKKYPTRKKPRVWTDAEDYRLALAYSVGGRWAAKTALPNIPYDDICLRINALKLRRKGSLCVKTEARYARLTPLDPETHVPSEFDYPIVVRKHVGQWAVESVPAVRSVFDLGALA
ncbi:MAG TPA: hypothetical protein VFM48_06630 [Aquabacterium sp.]|nr:hypothetical protein [Aquabacterium sp.]